MLKSGQNACARACVGTVNYDQLTKTTLSQACYVPMSTLSKVQASTTTEECPSETNAKTLIIASNKPSKLAFVTTELGVIGTKHGS